MEQLIIKGGVVLEGEVKISGAKNAAVAILPAALLASGTSCISNVPDIMDIKNLIEGLKSLGVSCDTTVENEIKMDCTNIATQKAVNEHVKKIRASYYFLGALLGRFKKAEVTMPGGCSIGDRPIDQHIKGFKALGATVKLEHGLIKVEAEKLVGTNIYLDVISVGATINIMLAATLAEGKTVLENCAKEPHVVDVANFLNKLGANIKGAGTDTIKIVGVKELKGTDYSIISDQIEAGTYMVGVAMTKGDVVIKNIIPKHLESITSKLREVGCTIDIMGDSLRIHVEKELIPCRVKTMSYPGFPTDMQPQIMSLLSVIKGTSQVNETVWDSRFQYIAELKRLGAKISIQGSMANVTGVDGLSGCEVTATDLRAGAALFLCGLIADGETKINNAIYIDRGYEKIEKKLRGLGVDVRRVTKDE